MNKHFFKSLKSLIVILSLLVFSFIAQAHPGRTDKLGCHTCKTNCANWGLSQGEYHCHNSKGLAQPEEPIQNNYQPTSAPSPSLTTVSSPSKTVNPPSTSELLEEKPLTTNAAEPEKQPKSMPESKIIESPLLHTNEKVVSEPKNSSETVSETNKSSSSENPGTPIPGLIIMGGIVWWIKKKIKKK